MNWRPHDLIWVSRTALMAAPYPTDAAPPRWVSEGEGPVVVRRERMSNSDWIPVGVRGHNKSERYAAYVRRTEVNVGVTPYQLATARGWRQHLLGDRHPALIMLQQLAEILDGHGLAWGVTGSVGYELATGESQLRPGSDLDLVIDSPQPVSRAQANALLTQIGQPLCRLDIQLETGFGAVALAEWAGSSAKVMVRTDTGPYLTTSPWRSFMAERSLCPA